MKAIFKIFMALILIVVVYIALNYKADVPVSKLREKYAMPPSQFMELRGMNVHYRDEGPASDSVPLVLLHGTSSFLQTWNACTAEWIKTRRVIRMDLPAFGLTGPDPKGDYSVEGYLLFLNSFLTKLNVKQFYLAGNSLGGLIAYSYAAAYPNEVRKLILIDPAGYPNQDAKGALAFKLARMRGINKLFKVLTPRIIVRKSLEDVYGDDRLVTDSLVEIYRDMTIREGNRAAMLQRINMDYAPDTSVIKKIKMPTLVVWGELDQLIPVSHAYRFQRDLPHNKLVVLKGVGHIAMEESPNIVAPLIADFLK